MAEETFVPFMQYTKAEVYDMGYHYQRTDEDRKRLWTLAVFDDPHGDTHLVEGRVVIEFARDFCGGVIISSPQILDRSYNTWAHHEDWYIAPGPSPDDLNIDLSWQKLLEDRQGRAIDLNLLYDKAFSVGEARDLLWRSMAAAVVGFMIGVGKNGAVAADREGGKVCRLMKEIEKLSDTYVPMGAISRHQSIRDDKPADYEYAVERDYRVAKVPFIEVTRAPHYRNSNTGCRVLWHSIQFIDPDDDYFEENPVQVSPEYLRVPKCVAPTLQSQNFVRACPRFFWRNG